LLSRLFLAALVWGLSGELEPLGAVLQYVQTQEEHHRTHTFQEDSREVLRRHGGEFDERYVWD